MLEGGMRPGRRRRGLPQYAQTLRRLLAQEGWQQDELGRRVGYADGTIISKYLAGEQLPPLEVALEIARLLHTTVEAMCGLGEAGTTIHHHHAPGEVQVTVSNPGLVVFDKYAREDVDAWVAAWSRLRAQGTEEPPAD
jgi:transcriptional regulator with XRE-family HTH domain